MVVVGGDAPEALEPFVTKLGASLRLTARVVACTSADPATRANAGLAAARGQYVAVVEAGALLSPRHFAALVSQLARGTTAWALSMPPQSVKAPFRLAQWLELGAVDLRALAGRPRPPGVVCVDPRQGSPWYAQLLFVRLALLFPPAFVEGPVTIDVPGHAPGDVRGLLEQLRGRPLRALATLESLFERPTLTTLAQTRVERRWPRVRAGPLAGHSGCFVARWVDEGAAPSISDADHAGAVRRRGRCAAAVRR